MRDDLPIQPPEVPLNQPGFELPGAEETIPLSPPPDRRHPWTWALLTTLFVLLIGMATAQYVQEFQRVKSGGYDAAQSQLENFMRMRPLLGQPGTADKPNRNLKQALEPIENKAKQGLGEDVLATKLYVAARFEQGKEIVADDLTLLEESEEKADRAFAQIYLQRELTKPEAKKLSDDIPDEPYVNALAKKHAEQRSSPEAKSGGLSAQALQLLLVMLVGFLFLAVGVVAWLGYIVMRANGSLKPAGHPVQKLTKGDGDRLALRSVLIVLGFFLVGFLGLPSYGKALGSGLQAILLLSLIVALFAVPILGKRITLADIGVTSKNLGANVLWGIGGYFANIPVLLGTVMVSGVLMKFLPPPSHPVSEQLMNSSDAATVFSALLLGAVVAPIWEEIMFRGTFFGGLSRVWRSVVGSAIVTSLAFAMIHPQGPVGWLPIAAIGCVSCLLVYQTGSLVPSIVMHALHNFSLMTLTLMMRA